MQLRLLSPSIIRLLWCAVLWCAFLACWFVPQAKAQGSVYPPPSPGASSCSNTGANWLTCTISGSTLTIDAATGQASHQVIGTCGSATSFGPCTLGTADLPSSVLLSGGALGTPSGGSAINLTGYPSSALSGAVPRSLGGLNSTSAGTGLLRDGTTPAASEISGDCTTSGSNAITCTKTNGTNFATSATTDTTNASHISTGTLGFARLPSPAGGGPAGVVAVLTAATGGISNTATQVIGYTVPSGTLATGTTYSIEVSGNQTTSTSPGNDTFSIEFGSASLSGSNIVQAVVPATASASNQAVWIRAVVTVFASTISGQVIVCGTTSGAFTATCKVSVAASLSYTAGQSNVLELVYQSGAATSSINFGVGMIKLEKP